MPAVAGPRVRAVVLAVVLLVGVTVVADATAAVGSAPGATVVESSTPDSRLERPRSTDALPNTDALLSIDGVTFSPSSSGQVLHRVGALVPGESVSAALWVRNPTGARAQWRVDVRDLTVSSATYAESVTLSTWHTGVDTALTATLDDLSPCAALASSASLAPGQTAKLLLTFGMDLNADNSTQDQAATLRIQVTMRDGAAGPLAPPACEDGAVTTASDPDRPATLAHTGSVPPTAAIAFGALSTGTGLSLLGLRRSRRRRRIEEGR